LKEYKMKKFTWIAPCKEKLKDMVTVAFIISGFRAKNPDWARKAITEYYARLKAKQR